MPLLILGVSVPTAQADSRPAGIQYEYSPFPSGGSGPGPDSAPSSFASQLPGSGIPWLLVAAVVLIGAIFVAVKLHRGGTGSGWRRVSRPAAPFALAGAILAGVLVLGATGSTAAPTPKAPKAFVGIAPQEGYSSDDAARMARGGIGQVRVPVAWSTVEPEAGVFSWGALDASVRTAAEQKLPILPVLYATPAWLAKRTTTLPVSATQMAAWKEFVAAAVERYGNNGTFWDEPEQAEVPRVPIREWQIWNEVNFHYFATPVSVANYAKILKAASSEIKSRDSRAKIVLSGLFGRPKGPPRKAVAAATFIKQLGRRVKPSVFDLAALHPYTPDTKQLKKVLADFRNAMNKAGYRSKPIQVTEIGWGSGRRTNAFLTGSEAKQAKQLTSAMAYLIKARHKFKLKRVYWFTWKDTNPRGTNCSFCYTSGLFRWGSGLKAKPAWRAMVRLTGGRP